MSRSYFFLTVAVMSVAMRPGRTSNTSMPRPDRASAKSVAVMLKAALDTQYSGREVEDTEAEMEVMKTMAGRRPPRRGFWATILLAAFWVRKNGPRALMAMRRS